MQFYRVGREKGYKNLESGVSMGIQWRGHDSISLSLLEIWYGEDSQTKNDLGIVGAIKSSHSILQHLNQRNQGLYTVTRVDEEFRRSCNHVHIWVPTCRHHHPPNLGLGLVQSIHVSCIICSSWRQSRMVSG